MAACFVIISLSLLRTRAVALAIGHRRSLGIWRQGASEQSGSVTIEKLTSKEQIVSDERLFESNQVARLRSVYIN